MKGRPITMPSSSAITVGMPRLSTCVRTEVSRRKRPGKSTGLRLAHLRAGFRGMYALQNVITSELVRGRALGLPAQGAAEFMWANASGSAAHPYIARGGLES